MSATPMSLPNLAGQDRRPLRLTPTDVSQFVRLEQCERYLRFRLAERAGQDFMDDYGVTPQRITPLLSLSGHGFEERIEAALARAFRTVHYADEPPRGPQPSRQQPRGRRRGPAAPPRRDRRPVPAPPGGRLDGWRLRGDVDLLRLERDADGDLHALIADMKSHREARSSTASRSPSTASCWSGSSRTRHRPCSRSRRASSSARPPTRPRGGRASSAAAGGRPAGVRPRRRPAGSRGRPEAYLQAVHDLVLGTDSTARRVAQAPFDDLPFCLSYKCDGCLYNEFCMKWSAEHDDLSLLPYMTGHEKEALRRRDHDGPGPRHAQGLRPPTGTANPGTRPGPRPGGAGPAAGRHLAGRPPARRTRPPGPELPPQRPQGRHPGPRLHPRQGQQFAAGVPSPT